MVALVTRVKNKFRCDIQQIDGLCDDICIESWFGLVYMQTPTNCCQFFKISLHFCSSWHIVYDKIGKIENGFSQKCACTQLVVSRVRWKKKRNKYDSILELEKLKNTLIRWTCAVFKLFLIYIEPNRIEGRKKQTEVNGRKKKINAKYLLFIEAMDKSNGLVLHINGLFAPIRIFLSVASKRSSQEL